METQSIQAGQTEIGIVTFQDQTFQAKGASVSGRHITAYHSTDNRGRIVLTRWNGGAILVARCEIVKEFATEDWGKTYAILFRLPRGRFIVGYSLGKGCLFRGELLDDCDEDEARQSAVSESEYWINRDWEDEQQHRYEEELLDEDEDQEDDEDEA